MGFRKHYLGAVARPNEKNRWFLFRKAVRLPAAPTAAPLSITVDGRYVLYVNGAELGRGPVRCSPLFQRYDDYDLASALQAGDNVIAVLIHTYGRDTAFYETVKGGSRPSATAASGPTGPRRRPRGRCGSRPRRAGAASRPMRGR